MEKVTGIGGIFFKANDPEKLRKWYQENLGVPAGNRGYSQFYWREADVPEYGVQAVWSLFPEETRYFDPSHASRMIRYRVANLERMLAQLREAGVSVEGEVIEEYGRFAWVLDPEGNKIELWEPPASSPV